MRRLKLNVPYQGYMNIYYIFVYIIPYIYHPLYITYKICDHLPRQMRQYKLELLRRDTAWGESEHIKFKLFLDINIFQFFVFYRIQIYICDYIFYLYLSESKNVFTNTSLPSLSLLNTRNVSFSSFSVSESLIEVVKMFKIFRHQFEWICVLLNGLKEWKYLFYFVGLPNLLIHQFTKFRELYEA